MFILVLFCEFILVLDEIIWRVEFVICVVLFKFLLLMVLLNELLFVVRMLEMFFIFKDCGGLI